MQEIRIIPSEDGKWNWEHVYDDDLVTHGPGFVDRSSCIASARADGGAETVTVIRGDGSEETHITPANCRVVLLRLDGTEYGELDPPPSEGAVGHRLTLTPAGTDEEARTDG